MFHDVKFMDLSVADHLYCWRIGGTYAHHGVLVEKGEAPDTSFVAEFGPPRDSVAHEWDSRCGRELGGHRTALSEPDFPLGRMFTCRRPGGHWQICTDTHVYAYTCIRVYMYTRIRMVCRHCVYT